MGAKGFLKFLIRRAFVLVILGALIVFIPNLPPYTSFSEPFRVKPFTQLDGILALKERLSSAEIWHTGDIIGPEAFAEYNGELYASLYGGDVVKFVGEHIIPVAKTGKPCKGPHEERVCGRPLGMQFDRHGMLYVADAYYGLFKINVKTGVKEILVSPNEEIEGKRTKTFNSLVLADNGDIYWTASSTEFTLEDGVFDLLADPSGRLIHYDAKSKKNRVLVDKLHFANGVQLSQNEEFVIVAETNRNRIHRYYLKGPQKGVHNIFLDLPGMPDNLKSDGKGGFFVPLIVSADVDHPVPSQIIGPFPKIRKLAARIMGLVELVFETIDRMYPNDFSKKAVHFVGHFSSSLGLFSSNRTTILHVSVNGEVIDCLHNLNRRIAHISEVHIYQNLLYFGSPFNDYIARIPLHEVGWNHLSILPKAAATQHTISTERPSTTTSRPSATKTYKTTQTSSEATKPSTTNRPPTKNPASSASQENVKVTAQKHTVRKDDTPKADTPTKSSKKTPSTSKEQSATKQSKQQKTSEATRK